MNKITINGQIIDLPVLLTDTVLYADYYLYKFVEGSEWRVDQILQIKDVLPGKYLVLDIATRETFEVNINQLLFETSAHWFYSNIYHNFKHKLPY